jgi:large subunit ribosomal protein L1
MKPASSKGAYLRGIALSTTMSPGVKIDPIQVRNLLK